MKVKRKVTLIADFDNELLKKSLPEIVKHMIKDAKINKTSEYIRFWKKSYVRFDFFDGYSYILLEESDWFAYWWCRLTAKRSKEDIISIITSSID